MVVVSDDRAYFVGSTGYTATSNSLYRFNPGSDAAPVVVNGFADKDLGALAVDPYGQLWIGRSSDAAPGLSVLGFDGSTETVNKALIDTVLTPLNIDFVSAANDRSEEHTSELQSLMRISYAVFCLKKKHHKET